MLAGRPPFRSEAGQLVVDLQTKEPTDPRIIVPTIDPALVEIVRRAMHKRPEHRYQSAAEMAEALSLLGSPGAEGRSSIPSRMPSVPPRRPKRKRRRRSALTYARQHPLRVGLGLGTLVAAAILTAVLVVYLVRPHDAHSDREEPTTETPSIPELPSAPAAPSLGPDPEPPETICNDYLELRCRCGMDACDAAELQVSQWRAQGDESWAREACFEALADVPPCDGLEPTEPEVELSPR